MPFCIQKALAWRRGWRSFRLGTVSTFYDYRLAEASESGLRWAQWWSRRG